MCDCDVCQEAKIFFAKIEKMPPEDRAFFNNFYEQYVNQADERDYYKAIVHGTWPSADEVIRHARQKTINKSVKET